VRKILLKKLSKTDTTRFLEGLKNVKLPTLKEQKEYKTICESGKLYEYISDEFFIKTNKRFNKKED
jgi:hypothetical protein